MAWRIEPGSAYCASLRRCLGLASLEQCTGIQVGIAAGVAAT